MEYLIILTKTLIFRTFTNLLLLLLTFQVSSLEIRCIYGISAWNIVGSLYTCTVQNDLQITSRQDSVITSVSGSHEINKINDNVKAIYITNKTINYFPRGLENFFKNLEVIDFVNTKLKEVCKSDLKPFPKLIEIYLYQNEIEELEECLFDFNLDLKFIFMKDNKISRIHPNIFDHLTMLTSLYLSGNICIDIDSGLDNRIDTQQVIKKVQLQCNDFKNCQKYRSCEDASSSFEVLRNDINEFVGLFNLEKPPKNKVLNGINVIDDKVNSLVKVAVQNFNEIQMELKNIHHETDSRLQTLEKNLLAIDEKIGNLEEKITKILDKIKIGE